MSENNKQLVRRWFDEVWNRQRREAIAEMLHSGAILHEGGESVPALEGFFQYFDRMHSTFSDIRMHIDDALSEGDRVCVRWSCTMRHTGPGLGMAATGEQLRATGISIVKIADNKFIEAWQNWDMLGVMQQITKQPMAPTYIAAHQRLSPLDNG